jgi:hypothetical protein
VEQVLILNGLTGLVDTRGTAASCEQRTNGTVNCLDTPLGIAAARAAEVGGPPAAFVADRFDTLSQESRAKATDETVRADELEAAALSARRIGAAGSASLIDAQAAAARVKARAGLAQAAAAAATAQAVRLGDAPRARMAGDAVVAAAWKGELAEVQTGALRGLGAGLAVPTSERIVALSAGERKTIPAVARFVSSEPETVKGQIVGTGLVLTALKAGASSVQTVDAEGARTTYEVTVTGLTPAQGLALATRTFEEIKEIAAASPPLNIDWQDAAVLRTNYDLIYPILRKIRNTLIPPESWKPELPGFTPQKFQVQFMIGVLDTIKANPSIRTLREGILTYRPGITPTGGFAERRTATEGRECGRNSESGVVFHDLYTFTSSVATAQEILSTTVAIAKLAAPIVDAFKPGVGKAINKATATVEAVAGQAMVPFGSDPRRLISNFGNAICVAIAAGPSSLPLATRAASELRKRVQDNANRYRLNTLIAQDTRQSDVARQRAADTARSSLTIAQENLSRLAMLDTPAIFSSAQNETFLKAKEVVEAATPSLDPASGGGGGGGLVVAAGAAAAAFALWRFMR